MAGRNADGGGSSNINPGSLLALITVAAGLWLVSNKLTSTRPAPQPGSPGQLIGEQTLEARLWEDPFKDASGSSNDVSSKTLLLRIGQHDPINIVQLMPVMLAGGNYSEDQESRIRGRYAVVAALGEAGYAPDDAEHIGRLKVPWPTTAELQNLLKNGDLTATNLYLNWKSADLLSPQIANQMEVRFEWYRQREFQPDAGTDPHRTNVLVMWIDDTLFEDEPLLRLPLFLAPLIAANESSDTDGVSVAPRVTVIGPRRSATLRAMLPGNLSSAKASWKTNDLLWATVTNVLGKVELYSATASAMDAVLVETNFYGAPRSRVREVMTNNGFAAFYNFVATDDRLAREMLDELRLRQVDLCDPTNHLVLISEWDTFYGRMLSLTYGAELAVFQTPTNVAASNHITTDSMVRDFRAHGSMPTNFHYFVYLRGLDGQTLSGSRTVGNTGNDPAVKYSPASIEDLRKWIPDANKAEGPAQLDYLGRLGDRISELQETLWRAKSGSIRAAGIVGSDAYDTLLILQALRERFPNILFFTTDLDARFWHPREQHWTRNLVITSGYGLSLNTTHLQTRTPPFRDSQQTAEFAATLAALGNMELRSLTNVPVRRFEIGFRQAVNLSVEPSGRLHPPTLYELSNTPEGLAYKKATGILMLKALGLAILITAYYLGPWRWLSWNAFPRPARFLLYQEEDIGGGKGACALTRRLQNRADLGDVSSLKLMNEFRELRPDLFPPATADRNAGLRLLPLQRIASARHFKAQDRREREIEFWQQKLSGGFLDLLNSLLQQPDKLPPEMIRRLESPERKARAATRPLRLRRILDRWLTGLSGKPAATTPPKTGVDQELERETLVTAQFARHATGQLYLWRWKQLVSTNAIILAGVGLGALLIVTIRRNLYNTAGGEPFSLSAGVSAWPAEAIRLLAALLALKFILNSYRKLRTTIFELTRQFRLPLTRPGMLPAPRSALKLFRHSYRKLRAWARELLRLSQHPSAVFQLVHSQWKQYRSSKNRTATLGSRSVIRAVDLWELYQRHSRRRRRCLRIVPALIAYVGFAFLLFYLDGAPVLSPVRGEPAARWNDQLLKISVIGFLMLTFMTIDAAILCRWFIQHLGQAPTEYPRATSDYFSRLLGRVDPMYLDEYIDLQLIAELTERVGRMVYYPSIIFFLLLLARNEWWDHWPWPRALIAIFAFNFGLSLISIIILQQAARKAKSRSEATLEAKVKRARAAIAQSPAHNDANQAEKVLEEIRSLQRGAFVPFWQNPVVGALLLPSSGTALLQAVVWFIGH